ncbi:NUDIX domain-containing protein [Candidatus Saccharibacteria bacterium]|nr:NUDIX domain-containing protein [Candidatus Saccharibacteria bacterium]
MRRGVDHIGVTVCFVVHDGAGNVLLQKRSQQCRDEKGHWDIGGGALEFGETIQDAVRREVYEELLVDVLALEFLFSFEALRDNNGIPTHWIAMSHAVKVDPAKVKIGEPRKIDKIGWFTTKNLPKPLHSQMKKSLDRAKAEGIIK